MERPEALDEDLDLRRQDGHLDRLRDVLVRALRVAGEHVVGLLPRREHHHGDARGPMVGPEAAGELEPIHVRHVHVGDHEVGRLGADHLQRLPAVVGERDLVTVARQPGREQLPDLLLVVHKEDAFPGH